MDLLIIGWDGASHRHLDQFELPFWDQLDHNDFLYPEDLFYDASYISSANAWTTMTTGARFDQHRILGFVYGKYSGHPLMKGLSGLARSSVVPEFFRRVLVSEGIGRLATDSGRVGKGRSHIQSSDIPFKRVWELLPGSSQVFGLPLTYPTWEMDGVLMSGIPAPRPEEATQPLVSPPSVQSEVYDGSHNGYYVDLASPVNDSTVDEREYAEAHLDKSEALTERYLDVYQSSEEDPTFGFLMLRSIDDVLHATLDKDIIREVYERIDAVTSELVDAIDPDDVLVLSDHGMAPTSRLRVDKDLKMDHDTRQGVWGGTADFNLSNQVDVAPAILEHFDIEADLPQDRETYDLHTEGLDNEAVHQRLKDLGYA